MYSCLFKAFEIFFLFGTRRDFSSSAKISICLSAEIFFFFNDSVENFAGRRTKIISLIIFNNKNSIKNTNKDFVIKLWFKYLEKIILYFVLKYGLIKSDLKNQIKKVYRNHYLIPALSEETVD